MSYKTILVHIDAGERWPARLDIAVQFAQRFDAHLVGLHALTAVRMPGFTLPEAGLVMDEVHNRIDAEESKARTQFERLVKQAGLTRAEWRASREDAAEVVALQARYADLLVIGQPDANRPGGLEPDFAHQVVLSADRPVLLVPFVGRFDAVGKEVLLAWDARREAARAVTDSLPLLQQAERVRVVCIKPEGSPHGEQPGADIALYLARHGVRAEVSNLYGRDVDAGNQLLSYAADRSADLIVMGAYGHSRLREVVLGGVTRTLMDSMTVPVLMGH
jgi:nucleotide-binding universal stress UspA family protein